MAKSWMAKQSKTTAPTGPTQREWNKRCWERCAATAPEWPVSRCIGNGCCLSAAGTTGQRPPTCSDGFDGAAHHVDTTTRPATQRWAKPEGHLRAARWTLGAVPLREYFIQIPQDWVGLSLNPLKKEKKKCLNFDPSGIGNPGNNYWEDHQKHLRWINVQKERLFVFPDAWRSRPNGNFTESSPGHWDSLPIAEAVQSFVWFWISAWSELQPSDFSRQIRLTNTLTWQPHPRAHQYLLDVFCVTFALQNGLFHTSYRLSFSGRFGAILSSERP